MSESTSPAWFCEGPDERWDVFYSPKPEDSVALFALKHSCKVEEVECRRVEELDRFFPGPVTPSNYVEAGWIFDCQNPQCSHQVDTHGCVIDDDEVEEEGGGEEEHDEGPVFDADLVYCCGDCQKADSERRTSERKGRNEAKRLVSEDALRQWPGVTIVKTMAVEIEDAGKKTWIGVVNFRFPGATADVVWVYGDENLLVGASDIQAWQNFLGAPRKG